MAREIHSLTDATNETLTDNVKAISAAMDKSGSFFYGILDGTKTDPFAPFLKLYRGLLKGGISTCHYDNELEFERSRVVKNLRPKEPAECFQDKLRVHHSTMSKFIESLADGELDLDEIKQIEVCLEQEKQNIELIETMLNFRRSVLEGNRK